VLTVRETMALGKLGTKWWREKRVPGQCGEGELLWEPFVGPAKRSLCAIRVIVVEETVGTYGFSFG
jgi:hypothetical protein